MGDRQLANAALASSRTKVRTMVEFQLLGPVEARVGQRVLVLGGPGQRALLALLLVHANEPLSLDRLVDQLWNGQPPPTAAKIVQLYVSRLRKELAAAGQDRLLLTRAPGYVLQVQPDQIDALRFRRLHAEGRTALAAGDPARASRLMEQALALHRGQPLADVADSEFARAPAAELYERRLVALEDRAEAELALGRRDGLGAELERLVAGPPLRERLREQLMLALYRVGRQPDALAT